MVLTSAGSNIVVNETANDDGTTNYEVALADDITVNSVTANEVYAGPVTINEDGIDAGNTVISNVAPGVEGTDAVNVDQLTTEVAASKEEVKSSDGSVTVTTTQNEDGANVYDLSVDVPEVDLEPVYDRMDDLEAGISGAMAQAAIPQAYIPGKTMIAGGMGTYNGQAAAAVGISKLSDNGRWVFKLQGSADTRGNAGASAGVGMHF